MQHAFQVQDKVSFLVNNLTRDNLDAKADDLKKLLKPEMWPWFCNYMVIRRVAQEANHQNLYLQVSFWNAAHLSTVLQKEGSSLHGQHLPA